MLRGFNVEFKPPLRDGQEKEGEDTRHPPSKPISEYTLSEVKEYCEAFEECPNNQDCAFYKMCAIWPYDWKLKE